MHMRNIKLSLIIVFTLITRVTFTQNQSVKDFERANIYYNNGAYYLAGEYYQLCQQNYRKHSDWLLRYAACKVQLNYTEEAENLLWRLYYKSKNDESILQLANVLIRNGKYRKAKELLQQVSQRNLKFNLLLQSCDSSLSWNKKNIEVQNLSSLNTIYDELSPVIFKDNLYYSSSKEKNIIHPKSDVTGNPYFDIYLAIKKNKGWNASKKYRNRLNTVNNDEFGLTFSSDSTSIFITRRELEDSTSNYVVSKMYNYVSENGKWKEPLIFNYNIPGTNFMHPSPSLSGRLLFFASDMPGGFGGTDLYYCIKTNGIWSAPINLGPQVNTPFDELYPHYTEGSLRFSSNGHAGLGGFDIFEVKQINGTWGQVVNLKAPVNSSANDISYIITQDGAFFASNRKGGAGGYDLYQIK